MVNPVWPVTLPQSVRIGSYREQPEPAVVEFPVEAGAPKRRRRISSPQRIMEHSVLLTVAQRAILLDFYEDDCEAGAVNFDWDHPIDNTADTWQFMEPPTFQLVSGNRFEAVVKLRKMP